MDLHKLHRIQDADEFPVGEQTTETKPDSTKPLDKGKITTANSKERFNEIKNYLKKLKYPNFVEALDQIVQDPKNKALLGEGFGGDFSDLKLDMTVEDIHVTKLLPSQNEVDVNKSLSYGLKNPQTIGNYFLKVVEIKSPIITFNGNFIIDGHHRWSQVYCFNPTAVMKAINYEGDLSAIEMLRVTQGAIATDIGNVPTSTVEGQNLLEIGEKELKDFVRKTAAEGVVEELAKHVGNIKDIESVCSFLWQNVQRMQTENEPIQQAPQRDVMPQTDESDKALKTLEKGVTSI